MKHRLVTRFSLTVTPQAGRAIQRLRNRGLHGATRTDVVRGLLYRAIEDVENSRRSWSDLKRWVLARRAA